MALSLATYPEATAARQLACALQDRLRTELEGIAREHGDGAPLVRVEWLRDGGERGGGWRYEASGTAVFDQLTINVSQVHYPEPLPAHPLRSATAFSAIAHPRAPRAPSVHIHVSFTDRGAQGASWRVMADLNPAIASPPQTARFAQAVRRAAGPHGDQAEAQGERYFYIPALGRARGAAHFYLEGVRSGSPPADAALARGMAEAAIDTYGAILREVLADPAADPDAAPERERRAQLAYRTLYFFQVCTRDRGTTAGVLVHDQNDAGVLGSLPRFVDPARLRSWRERLPDPQRPLLEALVEAVGSQTPAEVTAAVRVDIARRLRAHYAAHPEGREHLAPLAPPSADDLTWREQRALIQALQRRLAETPADLERAQALWAAKRSARYDFRSPAAAVRIFGAAARADAAAARALAESLHALWQETGAVPRVGDVDADLRAAITAAADDGGGEALQWLRDALTLSAAS